MFDLLSGIDLVNAVDQKIEKIRTKSLDLSFNELMDMYEDGELVISPDYQRLFRWTEGSQSRFIESLILEMPVPPIFFIEREEGIYELIDGLQRISSYLHFRGRHEMRKNDDGTFKQLELSDCDIVPELNGYTYDDLPKAMAIKLKRNFIRVEILRKESYQRLRYYMFKRLNTGGENLKPQEIRNSTIKLLNDDFNQFIISMSKINSFQRCIDNISDEKKEQRYDQELVLRFFAFKNYRDEYKHDVGEFLTDYMEEVSDPSNTTVNFDYDREEALFKKTFDILSKTLDNQIFSGMNKNGNLITRFLTYHYEAFTLGIQNAINRIDPEDGDIIEKLKEIFLDIKNDDEFRKMTTGGGKNYSRPLNDRISFVQTRVDGLL